MPKKAKTAATKKTTTKKGPAKKAAAKKAPVKKAAAKKAPVKKTAAKKSTAARKKPVAKKAPAKKTTAKKPATKKTPAKKVAAKKAPAKKTVTKKSAGRKPAAKKAVAKKPAGKKTRANVKTPKKNLKATTRGKKTVAVGKKKSVAPAKAAAKRPKTSKKTNLNKSKKTAKTPPAKKTAAKKTTAKTTGKKRTTEAVKEAARKISGKTPAATKSQSKKKMGDKRSDTRKKPTRNIAFSLDEALEIASQSEKTRKGDKSNGNGASASKNAARGASNGKRKIVDEEVKNDNSVHGAASIADILGYNPEGKTKPPSEEDDIPKKHLRFYKLLVELRDHVVSELDLHTQDTLKRSAKEDSGNLSSYSQHLADAGTDTFDRDFALSLVSSEQEALYEIEEAIQRIKTGNYGVCEFTGKPIKKERLLAVPFARFSVEGQAEYERTHRKSAQRGGAFAESGEETVKFLEDEADE